MAQSSQNLILHQKEADQLSSWIGKPCHFQILYKISRDGLSAQTFHKLCDNKGPTVTVLHNSIGNVFGGYLSDSWNSNNSTIKDEKAFLFQLKNRNTSSAQKFNVHKPEMAAYGVQFWGPTFGGSSKDLWEVKPNHLQFSPQLLDAQNFDLRTFSDNNIKYGYQGGFHFGQGRPFQNQQLINLNGQENLGNSYETSGCYACPLSEGDFRVIDLEVYLVKAIVKSAAKQTESSKSQPWREMPFWNVQSFQSLKDYITGYHPMEDSNVPDVNVLLLGQVGAGKSSFFNTINSIFRGEITSRACTGSSEHSLSKTFRKYRIRNPGTGRYLNLKLCDTRGLEESFGIKTQDVAYILDGHIPEHYQFNPASQATPKVQGFVRNPKLEDRIHCVAFVIDASTIDVITDSVVHHIKEIQNVIVEKVYLTKLDKICPDVDKDVTKIFTSTTCKQAVDKVAEMVGVPRSHVFPVKNYEKETRLHVSINILALTALRQTLVFADDFLEDQYEIGDVY
ncbi:interferon-induced protein 44-like [Saccostrea echinata]|uniref:interferon-induced protein 44-like n=1 Tax=Saccostrea echinata TaxID=191078 RepID=UPI002A81064D|nr:interferon-induced protein 44-like [Saccostrea echinata]